MNIFNRAVMSVLLLLFLLFWVLVALFVVYFPWLPREPIFGLRDAFNELGRAQSFNLAFVIAVVVLSLLFIAIGLLLLWWELTPRRSSGVRLTGVTTASAVLSESAMVQGIQEELGRLPWLKQVRVGVQSRGNAADLRLELYLEPGAELSPRTEEACRLARELLEKRMGVRVRRVEAEVHQRPLPMAPGRAGGPIVEETPAHLGTRSTGGGGPPVVQEEILVPETPAKEKFEESEEGRRST